MSVQGETVEPASTNATDRILESTVTTTYSYVYNGGQLVQETIATSVTENGTTTTTTDVLNYFYDASGLMSVDYNGDIYYYVTNLQGDIVAILNSSGTSVVTYTYDAWGNHLATTGTMAETLGDVNALRYRGYVYDTESGLYYLQSRYYDPEMGRFINADSLISTGQGILGNNMFAYCGNNPITRIDTFGNAFTDIIAVYYGQGEFSVFPSRLCIPNAKRTDSWQEMVDVTVAFFQEIIDSEPVQGALVVGSVASGSVDFYTGAITLFTPDPIPVADEIIALWMMINGLYNVLDGAPEIIASITWEEGK